MRRVTVDAMNWTEKEDMHRELKEKLSFPDWYGSNLDALYDMLTECDDTQLTVMNAYSLVTRWGEKAYTVFRVFTDSAQENKKLTLLLKA